MVLGAVRDGDGVLRVLLAEVPEGEPGADKGEGVWADWEEELAKVD